ncbi:PREDICTED: protein farnesyltransferase/geranylgeranyltransferase type-1 subunit alpha [Nicrophorus vespilloides]|uniref:Protein farnesyltransferase/geranylgeranyltransferase type-1 subunit alpha n=1 Tax=Nicrophorus vespilloides TaxID=110193 RepID=A0ABM1N5Y6_NICVS|nr:PREDICTED: protein farnesyltransferase/geranylgeranyltransferase type-1 subunit alpha [Nicrophorus vespilloides]
MGDSSDEEFQNSESWVFYRNRDDWKDVEPVEQEDGGEYPVVSISYTPKFKDVYDYLRGVMKIGEKSQRALDLTADAIALNAANYTVWQYRRDILKELKSDLAKELKYIEKVIQRHCKNYQVWHHRRVIVEWLQDSSKELKFTQGILVFDAKNYHAWQHRQWAIKTFGLYEGELEYVDSLLRDDIRNNSAWNQRYFVINNTIGFVDDVVSKEVEYVLEKIETVPLNESAWNYLKGLLLHDKGGLSNNVKVTTFCEDLYMSGNRSPFLLALIVDMCDERISNKAEDDKYNLKRASELCHELATTVDPIRCRYWEYMSTTISKKAGCESGEDAEGGDGPEEAAAAGASHDV